jgi:nitroreductase
MNDAAACLTTVVQYNLHIEAGHAAENVCLQAVALGLGTTVVAAFSDVEVKRLLGLGEEQPLLLIPVGKPG